jgi:Trk K+ transport system NAD-binding subunit
MNRQFVAVGLGRLGISMVKSLSELDLSQEIGLTGLALRPRGGPGSVPRGDTVVHDGDVLVVGGSKKALDRSPLVEPDGP